MLEDRRDELTGVRVLLVGNKADKSRERDVLEKECRALVESAEYYAYAEVCCLEFEAHGIPLVQQLLAELTGLDVPMEALRKTIADPSGRTSRSSTVKSSRAYASKTDDKKARSVSPPSRRPCARTSVWLYDPTEEVPSAVSGLQSNSAPTGDVKLRAISKAIYDIRGAGTEKCKAVAKYREREVNQWLTRSRYFGPTESSRHKRWQEDQKRKKQQQQLMMQQQKRKQQPGAMSVLPPPPRLERRRSLSHPGKFPPNLLEPASNSSSSDLSDSNEEATTPLYSATPSPEVVRMEQQLQSEAEAQRRRRAAKRAMRKKIRAASSDVYERHSPSWHQFDGSSIMAMDGAMHSPQPRHDMAGHAVNRQSPTSERPPIPPTDSLPRSEKTSPIGEPPAASTHTRALTAVSPVSASSSPVDHAKAKVDSLSQSLSRQCVISSLPDTQTVATEHSPTSSSHSMAVPAQDQTSSSSEGVSRQTDPVASSASLTKGIYDGGSSIAAHKPSVNPSSSTTSEEFDSTDIDEMLDYFDNVTLPL